MENLRSEEFEAAVEECKGVCAIAAETAAGMAEAFRSLSTAPGFAAI